MKQQYKTNDLILSSLKFKKPEKIRIVIDDKNVRLYIGPRDWQWDRATGEWIGQGTIYAGLSSSQRNEINGRREPSNLAGGVMTESRFTKQEAKRLSEVASELFDAIPKSKRMDFLGHLNDICLFIEAAERVAQEKRRRL